MSLASALACCSALTQVDQLVQHNPGAPRRQAAGLEGRIDPPAFPAPLASAANNHDQDQDPHGNEDNNGEQPGPPRHAPTTEPASTHGPRFYADTHAMRKNTGSRPADALTARQSAPLTRTWVAGRSSSAASLAGPITEGKPWLCCTMETQKSN
jgi:hypothetical protein